MTNVKYVYAWSAKYEAVTKQNRMYTHEMLKEVDPVGQRTVWRKSKVMESPLL